MASRTYPSRTLLLILLVAACDSNSHPRVVVLDDAPVDSSLDASTALNVVSVQTFGETPLFVRYREGSGPWQIPVDSGDVLELHVREKYELLAVCGSAETGYETGVEAGTYGESRGRTYLPCFGAFEDTQPPVAATGTMVQPGIVQLGYESATSATGNWSFELTVAPGLHDLVAAGNGRMLIRRDLAISAPLTMPSVDVVGNGVAMVPVPFQLIGTQPTDTLSSSYMLLTHNDFATFESVPGTTVQMAPATLLAGTDTQFVLLGASSGELYQRAFSPYTAQTPTTITMLPHPADIHFGAGRASWTSLTAGDGIELYNFSGLSLAHVSASPGWVGASTELVIDTDIPGFLPEWKLGAVESESFEVSRSVEQVSLRSGIRNSSQGKPSINRGTPRVTRQELVRTLLQAAPTGEIDPAVWHHAAR